MKKYDKFNLDGKVALITGAAGLLGKEHAIALLESGARVVLTDININKLTEIRNSILDEYRRDMVYTQVMDVTSEEDISKVESYLTQLGMGVDILINNAAIDPKVRIDESEKEFSRLENFDLNQWNMELAVGLTGTFLASKIFGSKMAGRACGGIILNISSDLSIISPDQRLYEIDKLPSNMQPVKPITYSVIKSGLIGMTKYLSTYWANDGVRVNSLSPGGVFNNQKQTFVDRVEKLIPLGRMANKDEYRAAIQFMCSDASSYMNGHNLVIDGGRSIW